MACKVSYIACFEHLSFKADNNWCGRVLIMILGTHLYALYSEYNYNVASLYALGFLAGAVSSPFIGAIVDKCGRKKSAMVYCLLEIIINQMEQYNCLVGLLLSRIIGGITTNLLFTVFESWVVTEHRRRGFAEENFEIILRDSVIASNLSAVASGLIAHHLAEKIGLSGPFRGAVSCTILALLLVAACWQENFGLPTPGNKHIKDILKDGVQIIFCDSRILRLGVIQGLTEGTLQTFVFLWSPTLLHLTLKSNCNTDRFASLFLDHNNEPAYGLIFGAYMACGALGGCSQEYVYNIIYNILENRLKNYQTFFSSVPIISIDDDTNSSNSCASSNLVATENSSNSEISSNDSDESITCCASDDDVRLMAANMQAAICFLFCSILLATPLYFQSFSLLLVAFFLYEFIIGIYLPCEGILRSIYLPEDEVCTLMTLLRVIVNVLVAFGVLSTNFVQ